MNIKLVTSLVALAVLAPLSNAATFVMEKKNTSYSIDGAGGAKKGQQIYLYNTSTKNVNQNWVQLSRGNGYYSYKKKNTNLCWDGGSGGSRGQKVTLQTCKSSDKDQQWKKIKVSGDTYRFQKRNASGYSIDGGRGGKNRQGLYLWTTSKTNVNQQWDLTRTDTDNSTPEPVNPGNAIYPHELMRNYDQWKITYPDGSEDKTLYLAENEYFKVNNSGNGIVFKAPIRKNNGTTKNSSYIRSELRERTENGNADIFWTTKGTHEVYVKQAITHLPIVKDHLVATQIHGDKSAGIDDAMVLRLEGKHLFLSFNGGKLRSDLTIKTNYSLGKIHEVIFKVVDGKHYVYYSEDGKLKSSYASGNASKYLVKDGSKSYVMNKNYDKSYFKIGNYTQSNSEEEGSKTGKSNNYGEVVVYDFYVDHK